MASSLIDQIHAAAEIGDMETLEKIESIGKYPAACRGCVKGDNAATARWLLGWVDAAELLARACRGGAARVVRMLLQEHPNTLSYLFYTRDEYADEWEYSSPLVLAADYGRGEVVRTLLEHGAAVEECLGRHNVVAAVGAVLQEYGIGVGACPAPLLYQAIRRLQDYRECFPERIEGLPPDLEERLTHTLPLVYKHH